MQLILIQLRCIQFHTKNDGNKHTVDKGKRVVFDRKGFTEQDIERALDGKYKPCVQRI